MPAPDSEWLHQHPDDTDAPPRPGVRGWLQRRQPWLLLTIGLLASVTLLTLTQSLPRIDRILQDNTRFALAHKASDQIVIVAIDDKSLAAIGRWPWRRALHAELLRRIGAQQPRCVGLDLLLSENDPEHPLDDKVLANAMLDAGCVVLPMALQTRGLKAQRELLPTPVLAEAASAIGHAHMSVDEDGVARSIYLREGFAGRPWPSFALALHDAAEVEAGRMPPPPDRLPEDPSVGDLDRPWLRGNHQLIVFAKRTMPFKTVSYVDVLRNTLPADTFRDRYVLVGATAVGLGDAYATTAPDGGGLMPGLEIFANVLQGLLDHRRVTVAQPWQDLLFNLVPLAVVLLGMLWLPPLGVLVLIGAMLALQVGIHVARQWVGVQFAPAAGFVGLVLVYPLWSLLRLNAAMRYLSRAAAQLAMDFGALSPPRPPSHAGDFLDRQMAATSAAARRVRDIHRFVRDGIDHLPDATLILDSLGLVRIANMAAQRHWEVQPHALLGRDAHTMLGNIRWRTTGAPMMPPGALVGSLQPIVGEGEDTVGRALLLRCVPFFDADNGHAGWMISLVDITRMRHALAQRDEALRFISHDIREPSASILTTIELARSHPESIDHTTAIGRIERHARTGLELADGFVNLARAEAQQFRPELLDLVALIEQAMDDAWASAKKGRVRLGAYDAPEEALFIGDRSLITRALANILSNAIKYSPPDTQVRCGLLDQDSHWTITVQDEGPGIAPELQSQLFQPFHRLHRDSMPEVHGVGLGLLLVRTVAHRHHGTVEIDSTVGSGSTVWLVLPKPTAAELEALATDKE